MTTEHRRRASKITPANSRPISTRSYPIQRSVFDPKSSSISAPICKWFSPFLTESAPQVEFGLTHSKHRTGEFLTEVRRHIKIPGIWSKFTQNRALISSNLKKAKLPEEIAWLRQ